MRYRINISTTTVSKEREVEVHDDSKKIGCINVTSCFNVDCWDCKFDEDKQYYLAELISRTKL